MKQKLIESIIREVTIVKRNENEAVDLAKIGVRIPRSDLLSLFLTSQQPRK